MNRLRTGRSEAAKISPNQVKICVLCGTLNHQSNGECWTCRWHGDFSRDEVTLQMAWQRLETLYEEVRLEHVTSSKMRAMGEFGTLEPVPAWRNLFGALQGWWERFQAGRDLRSAQRATRLHSRSHSSRTPTPPDQLGV
jgi:hypothetical protein